MKYLLYLCVLVSLYTSCAHDKESRIEDANAKLPSITKTSLVVLGTVQDAGSPHIACKKHCCKDLFENPDPTRKVVSLGLFDENTRQSYLLEASPDIVTQSKYLSKMTNSSSELPAGIFLTHAHIGHYTGLMYIGKESTNAKNVPVYAMPKMSDFLTNNGPWSQLVLNNNIQLVELSENEAITLSSNLKVEAMVVPHRDEFSETVGFKITGPNKSAIFIPDIDKWSKWKFEIQEVVSQVDYAFIDATFYSGEEINTRDISTIPHPFVIESMELFKDFGSEQKAKVHFIHFNHTNPLLNEMSIEYKEVKNQGFNIATFLDVFDL